MSLGLWPEAVPFDPNSGSASHDLSKHFDAGRMPAAALLVCARDLRGTEWPARAAIGLARALGAGERRVVLADLDFEQPALHELLHAANTEGVADAILFGASIERVMIEPAGEMFGFVPPGAVAPDPAELMAAPAWTRLLAELTSTDVLLLAYAPLGVPGLDALADRIRAVVVLADETEVAATAAMLPDTIRVEGVIRPVWPVTPEPAAEPPVAAAEPEREPEHEPQPEAAAAEPALAAKEDARQALKADIAARQRVAADPVETATESRPAESEKTLPAPRALKRAAWRRLLPWAAFILLVAAAGWLGGRLLAGPGETGPGPSGPDGAAVAEPAGSLLGFSVAIESYADFDSAVLRADSLSLAAPDLVFFVAPVLAADDAIIYRVLAGPMTDSATASATMLRLVGEGLKIAASEFDVRETPLAFLVGQYQFRGDAEQRIIELEAQDLPSYVIEVPYTRGPPRFYVYAGAYSGPSEALVMRDRLRAAGVEDTLVVRIGRSQP
jgi:hypothetical protein